MRVIKGSYFRQTFLNLFTFSVLPLKKYLFFLVSFFLSVALLYVSKTSSPLLEPVREFFLEANGRCRLSFHGAAGRFMEFKQFILNGQKILEKQRRLELENSELRQKLVSLAHIQQENEGLRKTLTVLSDFPQKMLTVSVLSSPLKGWNHFFLIAGGSSSGIQKGQPVFSPYGIVGQIHEVSEHTARVMPLTHRDFRIPVRGLSSQIEAILAGNGSAHPFLIYLQENRPLDVSEILVTSRHGGKFPPGHRVGHLAYTSEGGLSIHTYIQWHRLEFVQVGTGPLRQGFLSSQTSSD
ncbi:MAG: rod shape-determining protein MreC [Alphaproteobacteria bacterium]